MRIENGKVVYNTHLCDMGKKERAFIIIMMIIVFIFCMALLSFKGAQSDDDQSVKLHTLIQKEEKPGTYIVKGYLRFDTLAEALEYAQDNISGEIIMIPVEIIDENTD